MRKTLPQHVSVWKSILDQVNRDIEDSKEGFRLKKQQTWSKPKDTSLLRQEIIAMAAKLENLLGFRSLIVIHLTSLDYESSTLLLRLQHQHATAVKEAHELKESTLLQFGLLNLNLKDPDVTYARQSVLELEAELRKIEASLASSIMIPDHLEPVVASYGLALA